MANLTAGVQGHRGQATRLGHQSIKAWAKTWHGRLDVVLEADGTCRVTVSNDNHGPREVWSGNIEEAQP